MGLDIVLYGCYFRMCRDPHETSPYKHLHISIGISGKTHGIKDKHKHRCFQENNIIPYAIYAYSVFLSFCEYWVLHEGKRETSLWG